MAANIERGLFAQLRTVELEKGTPSLPPKNSTQDESAFCSLSRTSTVAKPELQDIEFEMLITKEAKVGKLTDAPDSTNRELQNLDNMLKT